MNNNNRHIPTGYKPSPLGPIPEDWEVKRLGDIAEIGSGGTPSKNHSEYWNGDIPWITTSLLNNPYIESAEEYITEAGLNNSSAKLLNAGVLLIAMYGQGQTRGKVSKLLISASTNQACAYVDIHTGLVDFIHQILIANYESIRNLSNDGNQKNLSLGIIGDIRIIFPPLSEQQRIVSVLSLWDTAIAKQTALIEQLTLLKRGLMQQLLTGKKRLKGFEGEWKEVRLGEIGKFVGGCAFNEQEQGGQTGIPFYKVSDMNLPGNESKMNIANNYVTHEQIERLGYIVIENEAIIFAKVGAAIALERKRYAKNFIIDNNMLAYLPNNNVWYMKYWFDSISLFKYIQVGALPSYNASDLSIIKLKMPSLKEQNAIASVLVNADKEIEIQKQKLAAMQEEKKGLMQVLLTGKRRVRK